MDKQEEFEYCLRAAISINVGPTEKRVVDFDIPNGIVYVSWFLEWITGFLFFSSSLPLTLVLYLICLYPFRSQ